jgi:predicted small metal-binding protein
MKVLKCRDVGFDCEAEVRASSEEEVLSQAAEHARQVHNTTVTPDVVDKVRQAIRDDQR